MPHLSYNVRLNFTIPEDRERILATLKAERDVFNFCSERYTVASLVELHRVCYHDFRKARPEVPSQIVIKGEQACLAAFRAASRGKVKERPIKRRLSLELDARICTIKGTNVRLTAIGGRPVRCSFTPYPKLQALLDAHSLASPAIFERDGDIWIKLCFEVAEKPVAPRKVLGVDVGINRAAATSEGKLFIDRQYNAEKRRLRFLKRQLKSAADKGSKTARRHLRKLGQKERNKSKHQTHALANAILKTDANVIVLEDLSKIKSKNKGRRFNNKLSQVPLFMLRDFLTYKAQAIGKMVETVPPYDTSKIDHRTNRKDGVRKGARYYGKDGVVMDADVNAAINIGLRSRTKLPVVTGNALDGCAILQLPNSREHKFSPDGQAAVNRPRMTVGCIKHSMVVTP